MLEYILQKVIFTEDWLTGLEEWICWSSLHLTRSGVKFFIFFATPVRSSVVRRPIVNIVSRSTSSRYIYLSIYLYMVHLCTLCVRADDDASSSRFALPVEVVEAAAAYVSPTTFHSKLSIFTPPRLYA